MRYRRSSSTKLSTRCNHYENARELGGGVVRETKRGSSDASLASYGRGDNIHFLSEALAFEDLWSKIERGLNRDSERLTFSGKEEFREILQKELNDDLGWIIVEEKGSDCKNDNYGVITYCGYLELLHKNKNFRYKVKIAYETALKKEEKDYGRINVIREEQLNKKIFYFDQYDKNGKELKASNFDSFNSFNTGDMDIGQKVDQLSIKKETTRVLSN